MMISKVDDLSAFLSKWYNIDDLSLAADDVTNDVMVPATLRSAWLKIGRLSLGYENWLRSGLSAPLACQDGLAAPGRLLVRDGIVQVVLENQGNWAIGYKEADTVPDPEVFSNFLEQEIAGTGFVPLGCRLSDLIVTTVLTETIFFGAVSSENIKELADTCARVVWTGHYYNAVGCGTEYERPSHQIRTNQDDSLLSLYWGNRFSGFVADCMIARERIQVFLND